MSDTNAVALGIVEEATFGTTPATPQIESLRITGTPSLQANPNFEKSDEIRSDRQVTDLALLGKEASGDIAQEMSHRANETLFEAVFHTDFVRYPNTINVVADQEITDVNTVANTVAVVSALGSAYVTDTLVKLDDFGDGNDGLIGVVVTGAAALITFAAGPTFVTNTAPQREARLHTVGFVSAASDDIDATASGLSSTATDFTDFALTVGQWIKIGGTATATKFVASANNDFCRISAITASALTFDILPSGWATETSATGITLRIWTGDSLVNQNLTVPTVASEHFYTLERRFTDHSSPSFELFTGMEAESMTISAPAQSRVTVVTSMQGSDQSISTSAIAGLVRLTAPDDLIMNSSSNVGQIMEAGADVASPNNVLEASITFRNNLRRQNAVGSVGSVGFGLGEWEVEVGLNTYFGSNDLVEKVLDNTETSFNVVFQDGATGATTRNAILIDVPRMKFSQGGGADVSGKNADTTVNLVGQGIRDQTYGYTARLQAFHHVEF